MFQLNRLFGAVGQGVPAFEHRGGARDYGRALQEGKRGALGDGGQTGEQQASNQAPLPGHAEVERQKPERGLTWRSPALRGFIAQRPVDRRVMRQLIHIARLANSPIRRLILACPIAIPTLVNVNVCIGELDQISKTSDM